VGVSRGADGVQDRAAVKGDSSAAGEGLWGVGNSVMGAVGSMPMTLWR
jgi:hypothetical protein